MPHPPTQAAALPVPRRSIPVAALPAPLPLAGLALFIAIAVLDRDNPAVVALAGGLALLLTGAHALARRRAAGRVRRWAAREAELIGFAGVVAHDLRAPLASAIAYADLLRDGLAGDGAAPPEPLAHAIDRIDLSLDRMARLIDDLLGYATARDGALAPRPVDLGALVAEVVAERTGHLTGPAVPEVRVGALPTVSADPGMARQLLDNLIGNALKYTVLGEPARVTVSAAVQRPGWVRLEVADRGVGIPPGQHGAVFDSFHRAHAAGTFAGTGLGLAICRRIAERHGGSIGAADNPGGGARFWVTLPLA